jgi:glycosyltransferase involved in cell wall biosynthesis
MLHLEESPRPAGQAPVPPSHPSLRGARVCIVRHAYFPDDPTVRKEVRALREAGCHVDVICLRRTGQSRREVVDGARILRLPLSHRRAGVVRYLWEYGMSLLLCSVAVTALHFRRRYDVVQANSMPDALAFAGAIPKALGAKLVLHLHEPTPELWVTKYGNERLRTLYRLQTRLEQAAIRFADESLTVSDALRRRYASRGADPSRLTVLRNVCDESFAEGAPEPVPAQPGFHLVTHGLIEDRCGQGLLIEAVRLLCDRVPALSVEIIGDGPDRPRLVERVRELGLADRVSLPGFLPHDELLRRLRAAHAGVVAMRRTPYSELVDTTKMYEYMALGLPVIASRLPVVADTFRERAVAFFEPDDAADLAATIQALAADPEAARAKAIAAAVEYEPLRWRTMKHTYLGVIERALARRAR